MTPVEIAEYRQRWMAGGNNHPISIHSDLRSKAKDFCKVQMHPQQWKISQYTNVYEDTFYFEYQQDANAFAQHFKEWLV